MDHVITTNHNDYHTKASWDIADAILTTAYKDPPTVLRIGGVLTKWVMCVGLHRLNAKDYKVSQLLEK